MFHTVERLDHLEDRELSDELERGRVVFFPTCPIPLPDEQDLNFLREVLPSHLSHKNPSYHTEVDRVMGVRGRDVVERTARILREHYRQVRMFLERVLKPFVPGWKLGTSSFRPLEEKGRVIRAHASSELIHVDAKAYGATHGDRILRFFVNVHPTRNREWVTKGTFPELYRKYGARAGVGGAKSLQEGLLNRAYSGALRGLGRLAPLIDTSPYDRLMHRFHNWMKDTPEFQQDPDGLRPLAFPPRSAWMVFTDMVSHACVTGQHAFIDTFIVPLRNCRLPELSPFHVLQTG